MLLQRLFTTQEEERHRIARELHDQMGQYLAALMMGLKSLEKSTEVTSPVRSRLVKLQELTTQFSQEVRRFALELRPAALDDLGLYAALTNYLDAWSKRNEIKIDFHSNGLTGQRLPAHIETIVYRLAQEALNNVLKHAQAQHLSVIVEYRDGRVLVVLEDDGIGFDVEAAINTPVPERGLGLMGMLERVESVKGTLEIESEPGGGTTIVARIPVTST
jgi:signal transduction histidine kinase